MSNDTYVTCSNPQCGARVRFNWALPEASCPIVCIACGIEIETTA